jgi:hypothetical protein
LSGDSCTHLTPAGFPSGIPGIHDESDGAIQQAPHPVRQVIFSVTAILFMVVSARGNGSGNGLGPIIVMIPGMIPLSAHCLIMR